MFSSLIFTVLSGSFAHAKSLTADDISSVRECVSGWMSASPELNPNREKWVRGNLVNLDQRKGTFNCPSPDPEVLAMMESADGKTFELTLIPADAKVRRYKFTTSTWPRTISISDLKYHCQSRTIRRAFGEVAEVIKADFNVRISSWKTQLNADDQKVYRLGERMFGFELVEKPASDAPELKESDMEKVDPPASEDLAEKILVQLVHHWIRVEDRFDDVKDVKRSIKSCAFTVRQLKEKTSDGLRGLDVYMQARSAVDRASSIFIAPIPGQPTIRDVTDKKFGKPVSAPARGTLDVPPPPLKTPQKKKQK